MHSTSSAATDDLAGNAHDDTPRRDVVPDERHRADQSPLADLDRREHDVPAEITAKRRIVGPTVQVSEGG